MTVVLHISSLVHASWSRQEEQRDPEQRHLLCSRGIPCRPSLLDLTGVFLNMMLYSTNFSLGRVAYVFLNTLASSLL